MQKITPSAILLLMLTAVAGAQSPTHPATQPGEPQPLKISDNHHYLLDATTNQPFFLLADTAWNLDSLTDEEIDTYLHDRASHGFNTIMFCLDFAPQATSENAYHQVAYTGPDKSQLNPDYFAHVDRTIATCTALRLHAIVFAMWGGDKAGTMNSYTPEHLHALGVTLGKHFQNQPNVILCAGGESTMPYVDAQRTNAIGSGLREGSAGHNLITLHPCSNRSTSQQFADAPWLDFYMSQVKSGKGGESVDPTSYTLADFNRTTDVKPTMLGEHRYETGTAEEPLIQRRSLYCSVFAGAAAYAYGHNALWQMTPHTGLPWMLKSWNPGVDKWSDALDTPAVSQLAHILPLLYSRPYLTRIPDQSLILSPQSKDFADHVQTTRDGTPGKNDATYIMAYLASNKSVTLNTPVIPAGTLTLSRFDPATGKTTLLQSSLPNTTPFTYTPPPTATDTVLILDNPANHYPVPTATP